MSALSTIFNLTRGDFGRQKSRLKIAALCYGVAGLFGVFALATAGAALAIYLAETYGLLVALILVSAICLSVSAVAIIINAIYQHRQRRKLAQSAAIKGAATATLMSVAQRRMGVAPILVALIGYAAASQMKSDKT